MINTKQAAELLGYSLSHTKRLILNGKIKAEKVGSYYVINEKDINRFKKLRDAIR